MATYAESIREALNAYPDTDTFLHRRSKESVAAAKYLTEKIGAHTDEATLRRIVYFLLTGGNPPESKPPDLKKLKHGGKLYTLLDGAQRGRVNKKLSEYEGKLTKMADDPDAVGIDLSIRQKYDAAIHMWSDHKYVNSQFWGERREKTLGWLLTLSGDQHLEIIDGIWKDIIKLEVGGTAVANMEDPDRDGKAFASSHNLSQAFRGHGYAFRCDTRPPAQVSKQGFLPLYQFRCPEDIKGTILNRAATGEKMQRFLGFFKANRDSVGEMTICVSRQMRGCTKFPTPDYVGEAWIYALGLPPGKLGFDTELWQIGIGGTALWRPGEKAFYDVQPSEVLASLHIYKLGRSQQPGGYFTFQILNVPWEWHHANAEQQRHLNEELVDLYSRGQTQDVMEDDDFYKDQEIHQQPGARRLAPPQVGPVARPPQVVPVAWAPVGQAPPAQGGQSPTVKCDQCGQTFPKRFQLMTHGVSTGHRIDKAA